MRTFTADKLTVNVFDTRAEMGAAAAEACIAAMNDLLAKKDSIRVIYAAAPSQNEFLAALVKAGQEGRVDFTRVHAFHMDEYVGLSKDAPQGFGNFLRDRLFGLVPFASVTYLNGNADTAEECARYTAALQEAPIDLICMGIGENGHIAFNDPPVADFNDPAWVKVVELDPICRQQQVNDGCFATLDEVPTHALTLTVPTLIKPEVGFCIVPASTKANAVKATVEGPVSTACPASILRTTGNVSLWIDADSAAKLTV